MTILIRRDDFSCAAAVAEKAKNHEKITVLTNTVLEAVAGSDGLTYARYRNTLTGEVTEYKSEDTFGVFVLAGYTPATELLRGLLALNEQGYVLTDAAQKTSAEGVYAAGDVCVKPLRQVVTATGDGALAATELEKYVAALQEKTGLRGDPRREPSTPAAEGNTGTPFEAGDRQQLEAVFARMDRPLVLKLQLDDRPVSRELETFANALAALSPKLTVTAGRGDGTADPPCVRICAADGQETGLAFHGVPGGHEFTGFVLGLYNAAGPGQSVDEALRQRMRALPGPVDMQMLVTLSCGMCPELVMAAQHIAAENPNVTAHVYDIQHFPELREKYRVMSVPCLVINGEQVSFGKKNIQQLLALLEAYTENTARS